jgi:hypothetical protein
MSSKDLFLSPTAEVQRHTRSEGPTGETVPQSFCFMNRSGFPTATPFSVFVSLITSGVYPTLYRYCISGQSVQRWARGWTVGVLGFDSRGAGNFSLHHRVQNGSGAHPASYPMGTRSSFPGGKAAGA